MTERFIPGRLTRKGDTSTLRSEGKFMGESNEGVKLPQPQDPVEGKSVIRGQATPHGLPKWYQDGIHESTKFSESHETSEEKIKSSAKTFAEEQGLNWDNLEVTVRKVFEERARELGPSMGAMNVNILDPNLYLDPGLQSVVRRIVNAPLGANVMDSRMEEIKRMLSSGNLDPNDITAAEQLLLSLENAQISQRNNIAESRFGLYLQPEDIEVMRTDGSIRWLDKQFDLLYKSVREGQELTSPVINNLQTVVSEAIRWLQYYKPAELDNFQTLFTQRLKIMTMRTYIGYRAIGEVKNAASQLGAHGLLSGFGMEEGKVTPMFNKLNELLDDERLKTALAGQQFGHVTPEIANELQDKVIQEQIRFAELGIGEFGDLRQATLNNIPLLPALQGESPQDTRQRTIQQEVERVQADMIRSVRIAYDLFVDTQRQAVIVARGRHLYGTENYFSDPASGPLNVYNFEDLLTEKFDLLNRPEYEFLNRMKLDLAEGYIKKKREKNRNFNLTKEEKLDLGRRLFRDLFAVPDFFSSGWRVEGIATSIEERFIARFVDSSADEQTRNQQTTDAIDKSRNMGLFLRLKGAGTGHHDEPWQITRQNAWERIAKYKPEEVVRLFRERGGAARDDIAKAYSESHNGAADSRRLGDLDPKERALLSDQEKRYLTFFENNLFRNNGVTNYDEFKEKYGPILRVIRDKGYKDLRTINIAQDGFTQQERESIERYFGNANEADNLIQMFSLMTDFSNGSINDLIKNNKFEDIYTRTINADDAILNELEKTEIKSIYRDANGNEITKKVRALSRRWAADQGGDALIRNWSDTENAVGAGEALMHFLKAEKQEKRLEAAMEFADKTSHYTSQLQLAKCLRYTFGTFLITSKKDFAWDVIGLDKLPFRQPMSDIERIYGPSGVPKSRDESRYIIDEIGSRLEGSLSKAAREGKLTPAQLKEAREQASEFLEELVEQTDNTIGDVVKRKGLSILFYLILAVLGEGYKTGTEAIKKAA
ncbi:MAG TPA: hypothetical protein VKC89_03130 [Patescibacteria group bacterium]|nr:hypothetical protein [Patescibacteria group bacterium]